MEMICFPRDPPVWVPKGRYESWVSLGNLGAPEDGMKTFSSTCILGMVKTISSSWFS